MKRVSFIHYLADSPWMRDYGPRFLEEIPQSTSSNSRMDGRSSDKEPTESLRGLGESGSGSMRGPRRRTILDHTYNRLRPRDNGFPSYLSALWGDTRYSMPLNHAGGNFHIFSKGEAFATERIESDNPGLKRWRLIAWFLGLAEIDLTLYPSFPSDFDQSGHIDMWMLPVSNHKVIVGQYPERFGQPHEITEKAVKDLRGRGYTVFRTPGWQSRGIHYTYTNALIFNHMVFVPVYKKFRQENRRALEVFENAFPQKQLIPVESSGPIKSSGALHCLVMNIPG